MEQKYIKRSKVLLTEYEKAVSVREAKPIVNMVKEFSECIDFFENEN